MSTLYGRIGSFVQAACGCTTDERTGELVSICPDHNQDKARVGDWIQTYMGVQFWPQDPLPEDVRLLDIAHALSNLCRFTGHSTHFYSVAQHSVHVSEQVPADDAKWGLMHDAAEAYLGDMPRPIKRNSQVGLEYEIVEHRLLRVICRKFSLPVVRPMSITLADDVLLMTEKRDLCPNSPAKWQETAKPLTEKIIPWTPKLAEHNFLQRAKELGLA